MSETLNLTKDNMGYWSIYRKKCYNDKNFHIIENEECKRLFQLLFTKLSKPAS